MAGGSGSTASPFLITDAYGLQGAATLSLSTSYQLKNNIDASLLNESAVSSGDSSGTQSTGFIPIGYPQIVLGAPITSSTTTSPGYSGTFDGNGMAISNLFIESALPTDLGLFVNIAASGVVKNLTLVNETVTSNFDPTIMIPNTSNQSISNNNPSTIAQQGMAQNVGGFAGTNFGAISNVALVSGDITIPGGYTITQPGKDRRRTMP